MKNTRSSIIYTLFGVLTLGFLLSAPQVRAETTQCTAITSLPTTISTQGIYCLTGNLATNLASGNAIEITVNNVSIDMNGFKLGNLAAGAGTTALGIFADQRKNITIRNGTIRGFLFGIWLDDISPFTASYVISNNQVVSTGGSTVSPSAWGIFVAGPGARLINNDITAVVAQGGNSDSFGIVLGLSANSVVEGNRVSDISSSPGGDSFGILMGDSSDIMVVNNRIATAEFGVFYDVSTGKYRDNSTGGIGDTAYSGGTDVGNNN
jgi:hypothetical protein